MRIKHYILFGFLILGFSCTDLDEDYYSRIPESKYPESDAQLASMTLDAYTHLGPLIDDAGWWFWLQEISSDELVFPTRDADWDEESGA
jgi:hypothetical protein